MLKYDPDNWSKVRVGGDTGYIRSDLISVQNIQQPSAQPTSAPSGTQPPSSEEPLIFQTTARVNLRAGPSTDTDIISKLASGTRVTALEYNPDGWSKVDVNGESGYIRSDLLRSGNPVVELLEWSTVKSILPRNVPLQVLDVRTGLSYTVQSFSNGQHADVEPRTTADTEILSRTFGGTWAYTPRPVWVTFNGRTVAAAIAGMPHGGGVISGNGMTGHICLHFKGSTPHNGNKAYEQRMQNAVTEAWNAR